ncbi:MAG TPA: hypothetical protein VNE62_05615, partial [Actinomycetota bacterium]|nr:hypothetical protein [Actinomycetota bacterium]
MTDHHTFSSGTGSVVVTRAGARVAELRCGEHLPNVLYDGPAPVAGGDRLWPAPELEVFYEDPDDPQSWRSPPEVDPGTWTMTLEGPGAVLRQEALGSRMSRHVRPLEELPFDCS